MRRRELASENCDLPSSRQAKVFNISRGSVYYRPRPVSPEDLTLMRRIDELHLERPSAGARMAHAIFSLAKVSWSAAGMSRR
jgi:putative transposase